MQIKLGDGNVIVTSTINALIFKKIDNKLTVGDMVDLKSQEIYVNDSFTLYFQSYLEVQELKKLLSGSYDNKQFSFKYVDFDLSNYQRKSVDCIIDQLNWIEKFMPKCQVI